MSDGRLLVVSLVYTSIVLDNILLTVVVPIIPDFLYQVEHPAAAAAASRSEAESVLVPEARLVGTPFLTNVLLRQAGGPPVALPADQALIGQDQAVPRWSRNDSVAAKATAAKQYSTETLIHENGRVGGLFASKAFVQLVVNPAVGSLTERKGYIKPLVAGTFTLLLSALLFAAVSSFPWLLLARSLQGVASACVCVAGMGMIARLYDEEKERSRVMGYVMGGIAMGVLLGYPFGSFLYDFVGKTAPFIILAITTAVVLCLQCIYILPLESKLTESEARPRGGLASSFRGLFSDPYILIVAGAIWFSTSAMAMLEPCLPIWLMDSIHPEKWQLGTVFMPDSLGYLIGTNFFAVIALRVGRYRMAIAAMSMVGLSAISVPYATCMWHLVPPHFCLGLGIGLVDSALMPLLARLVDDRHEAAYGEVYAIAQTAVSLAYGLAPLIGGHLVEVVGFPNIMRAVGICNLVYAPALFFLRKVAAPEDGEQPEKKPDCVGYGTSQTSRSASSTSELEYHQLQ